MTQRASQIPYRLRTPRSKASGDRLAVFYRHVALCATSLSTGAVFALMAVATYGQGDADALDGIWDLLKRNDVKVEHRQWTFAKGTITDRTPQKTREGTYRIDFGAKAIDFLEGDKPVLAGIFEFGSDRRTLKICGAEVPEGKSADDVRPRTLTLEKRRILYELARTK